MIIPRIVSVSVCQVQQQVTTLFVREMRRKIRGQAGHLR
jgi:hypothetical protein